MSEHMAWDWLVTGPVPAGTGLQRWSTTKAITRTSFGGSDVMIDRNDGTGIPVPTAITFQEWLRCHGIAEPAAMSLPVEHQLELFLAFARGEALSPAWLAAQPWLSPSALVPGRATFGWVSPATVDALLPAWYRTDDGITIEPTISTTKNWESYWLGSLGKSEKQFTSIFQEIPDCFYF